MWSDAFKVPPDASTHRMWLRACLLAQTAYSPQDFGVYVPRSTTDFRQVTLDGSTPPYWTWTEGGVRIVVVQGTFQNSQYPLQWGGWVSTSRLPVNQRVNALAAWWSTDIYNTLPNVPMVFIGHSLGGEIAILAHRAAWKAGLPVVGTIAIGAPGVVYAADYVADQWPQNIVLLNRLNDPVPYLFPADGTGATGGYLSPGRRYYIDDSGREAVGWQPINSFALSTMLATRWTGDHAPAAYTLAARVLVPQVVAQTVSIDP